MTVSVTVNSNELATAANNALAFIPANSTIKVARISIHPEEGIEFTATDSYAAGRDSCPIERHDEGDSLVMLISREALQGFDSAGRKDKKGIGSLTATPGDGIVFTPMDDTLPPEAHMDMTEKHADALDLYAAIDDMLEPEQTFRTAFQPQLLMRFSKVKADKAERIADVAIDDPDAPVLFKIGTTFRGLIMPVSREKHGEAVGTEGLW